MHGHKNSFYKAPRYLFRKLNILYLVRRHSDIGTFVDIGTGAGELDCTLAELGLKGLGIDFSDNAIEVAESVKASRGIKESSLKFVKGGIEKLSGQSFDLAVCCEVLEHIKDDRKFLSDIHKAKIKYLLISVPARQKWFDQFDKKVGHYRRYEKDQLIELLESSGFSIIQFSSYGYPFINASRLIRKMLAGKVATQSSTTDRTKQSGVNPIKMRGILGKLDIEPLIKPLFLFSLLFNKLNLSEGYLILCKKK